MDLAEETEAETAAAKENRITEETKAKTVTETAAETEADSSREENSITAQQGE